MLWDQINAPGFATMLYSLESKEQIKIKKYNAYDVYM